MGSIVAALGAWLSLIGTASAETPPAQLWQTPESGIAGSDAGEVDNQRGIGVDPATGHIYVADGENARISEFTPWGVFVKAWGWDVAPDGAPGDTVSDEFEICTTSCQQGDEGSGVGQFARPNGVAVDSLGKVYVFDRENARVQKFDSFGNFMLMLGGSANKTTGADVCTSADVEGGDECGAGSTGPAPGEFTTLEVGNYIAVGPGDVVFVGDTGRIQEFNPDGAVKGQVTGEALAGRTINALAIDGDGNFYVAFREEADVHRLSPAGALLGEPFDVQTPTAVAIDSAGNLYAINNGPNSGVAFLGQAEVLKFDPTGQCVLCPADDFDRAEEGVRLNGIATSPACGVAADTVYVAHWGGGKGFVRAFGPPPSDPSCPPPLNAPDIGAQFGVSAGTASATVRATINPHFWADTRYYVEYGVEPCAGGGCEVEPLPPGELLGAGVVDRFVSVDVTLNGLLPGTEYFFRFVAASSGGGPVRGAGGEIGVDGTEGSFVTFRAPTAPTPGCPLNSPFRSGLGSRLPDCRAYEMVSPVEKEGADIVALRTIAGVPARLVKSAVDGSGLTYSSYRAFADPDSAPWTSQYLAKRGSAGWTTEAISPPREGSSLVGNKIDLDVQYKAFSPDLCSGWVLQDAAPALDPAASADYANFYRRETCGSGYEALSVASLSVTAPLQFIPELQGLSDDGNCAVFRANGKLTANASSQVINGAGNYQVYESCRNGARPRLVSILPNGQASALHSSAGTASGGRLDHRENNVLRALSADGSRVYWTAATNDRFAPGKIYVRDNANVPQSALQNGDECTEPERACTYRVSETVSSANAHFLAADPTGSTALFSVGDDLHRFDFTSKSSQLLAKGVKGLLGASDDLSRIYLVSTEVLAGGASGGEPNVYLYEDEGFTFVATLSAIDVLQDPVPSAIHKAPSKRSTRVSPDGLQVAFMSTASLTGFDNTDASSGRPDAEVYLYDATAAGGGELLCVSCNPTQVRPSGREIGRFSNGKEPFWAAAQLPTWQSQLYPERALSADGGRLFFESFEALVPRDANGKADVYQWERAGRGDCDTQDSTFDADAGGCVDLISGGTGSRDSEFLDASADGSNVFFATASSLVTQDPGLVDVYDARIGGGFPAPPSPREPCVEQACQTPASAPGHPVPPSTALRDAESRKAKPRRRCGKRKRRVVRAGKVRCVRKAAHRRAERRRATR